MRSHISMRRMLTKASNLPSRHIMTKEKTEQRAFVLSFTSRARRSGADGAAGAAQEEAGKASGVAGEEGGINRGGGGGRGGRGGGGDGGRNLSARASRWARPANRDGEHAPRTTLQPSSLFDPYTEKMAIEKMNRSHTGRRLNWVWNLYRPLRRPSISCFSFNLDRPPDLIESFYVISFINQSDGWD